MAYCLEFCFELERADRHNFYLTHQLAGERDKINRINVELTDILEKRTDELKALEAAMKRVKTLSGLLPICASCKKVRDDRGYWKQIESYIRDHSDATFSHGICPECARKLYPDLKKTR